MNYQGLIAPGHYTAQIPYSEMAASILVKAISDWRKYGYLTEMTHNASYQRCLVAMGFSSPREELLTFFHSSWCEFLTGVAPSISYQEILREIEVPA